MKRLIIFITISLFIGIAQSAAQSLITKSDSISLAQDSVVKLVVPDYRGTIQWQKSIDGKSWMDLSGEDTDTLKVSPKDELLYRAMLSDGTCIPFYSDSAAVLSRMDSVTAYFITPSDSGLVLISDSVRLTSGIYSYFIDTTSFSGIDPGCVIFDKENGTIRKVNEVVQKGDTITLSTEQATMEDLFFDTFFKISTEMIKSGKILKSASLEEIQNELTDENGFIHPISVEVFSSDGILLKSTSIYNDLNENQGDLYFYKDFSTTLFKASGNFSIYDEETNTTKQYNGNVDISISEGYLKFDPEFKFEFEFKRPNIEWDNLKVNKAQLTKFKFYSEKSEFDLKALLNIKSDVEFSFGKKIKSDLPIFKYRITVPVFGIPLIIDFEVNSNMAYKMEFGGAVDVQAGYQHIEQISVGATYENKEWSKIWDYTKENNHFLNNTSEKYKFETRIEYYPSFELKFYGLVGPYFDIIPYWNFRARASSDNKDISMNLGVDAALGVSMEAFSKSVFSYEFGNWNVFELPLIRIPDHLQLLQGDNQQGYVSQKLPNSISVYVYDNLGNKQSDVNVYFNPLKGTVNNNAVSSNSSGVASCEWTMSSELGEHQMEIYIKNGADEILEDSKITISANAKEAIVVTVPSVTTSSPTTVTETTATLNGNVTSDGNSTITQRGFYWSETNQTPDENDNVEIVSGTNGNYNYTISGLEPGTKYYYRAFATNNQGTTIATTVEEFTTVQEEISNSIEIISVSPSIELEDGIKYNFSVIVEYNLVTVNSGILKIGFNTEAVNSYSMISDADFIVDKGSGTHTFNVTVTAKDWLSDGDFIVYVNLSENPHPATWTPLASDKFSLEFLEMSGTFIDSRDNNEYRWIKIGDQIWMAENLAYLPQVNPSSNVSTTESYYYVYGYNGAIVDEAKTKQNFITFGVLYNWPAALEACPNGWHLPTDDEWKELEMEIGLSPSEADGFNFRGTDEGAKLKTTYGWQDNGNGTDDYGFSGLPGGVSYNDGHFYYIGYYNFWWSATEIDTSPLWRHLASTRQSISRAKTYKANGFSVRCIKN